jgi:hypothetical protein
MSLRLNSVEFLILSRDNITALKVFEDGTGGLQFNHSLKPPDFLFENETIYYGRNETRVMDIIPLLK